MAKYAEWDLSNVCSFDSIFSVEKKHKFWPFWPDQLVWSVLIPPCCLLMFWVPRSCIDLPLLCILETDLLDLLVRKPGVKCSFTVSSVNHFLIIPGVKTKQL